MTSVMLQYLSLLPPTPCAWLEHFASDRLAKHHTGACDEHLTSHWAMHFSISILHMRTKHYTILRCISMPTRIGHASSQSG